jgi:hypothetical protein
MLAMPGTLIWDEVDLQKQPEVPPDAARAD